MEYPQENPPVESPEGHSNQSHRVRLQALASRPMVTYILLALTIFVYLLQTASVMLLGDDIPLRLGVKYNDWIIQGQVWRLLTPALLHASLLHIGFNMYALFSLGRELELYYGHKRFLALYLISVLGGNVFSFLLSQGSSVGASTGVFGVLAAEGVFLIRHRKLFGERSKSMLTNFVAILVVNIFLGMSNPSIDNWGHLGGFAGGLIFAWMAGPLLGGIAGHAPDFYLVDVHNTKRSMWVALGEWLLFCALAATGIIMMQR